mmetsp:Transcript_14557/g.39990  ORF Transcript_14557/g.39990 Transcript_14557/m.39990 type:complete len:220 (-) Transcript_14557:966-1625(-)
MGSWVPMVKERRHCCVTWQLESCLYQRGGLWELSSKKPLPPRRQWSMKSLPLMSNVADFLLRKPSCWRNLKQTMTMMPRPWISFAPVSLPSATNWRRLVQKRQRRECVKYCTVSASRRTWLMVPSVGCQEDGACASPWPRLCFSSQTCFCSMSPPTTWTSTPCCGWTSTCVATRKQFLLCLTTPTSSTLCVQTSFTWSREDCSSIVVGIPSSRRHTSYT